MSAAETCRLELQRMMKDGESNKYCADCGGFPATWASTNLGVFVCVACSGYHRSLGVHISFIKSATLDDWNEKLLHHFKQQGGNAAVNKKYEAKLESIDKIDPSFHQDHSRKIEIVKFIRNKYEKKIWYKDKSERKKRKSSKKVVKSTKTTRSKANKMPKPKDKHLINSRSPTQNSAESLSPSQSLTPSPNLSPVPKRKESLLSDDDLDEFHRDFNNQNARKEPKKVEKVPDILELIQEIPSVENQNQAMDHQNKGISEQQWFNFNDNTNGNKEAHHMKTGSAADAILSKYHHNSNSIPIVNMNMNMNINMNMNMNASFTNYPPPQYVQNNNNGNYPQQGHNSPLAMNYGGNIMFNPMMNQMKSSTPTLDNNNDNIMRKMTW